MLRNRIFRIRFSAPILFLFLIAGCTEYISDTEGRGNTPFQIINEAHNIGNDQYFKLFNLGKVSDPQSAANIFAFSYSTPRGSTFAYIGADGSFKVFYSPVFSDSPVSYNKITNEFWQLQREPTTADGYGRVFISIYNKDFKKRFEKEIATGVYYIYNPALLNTSDGGALIYYTEENKGLYIQKLRADLTLEFDFTLQGSSGVSAPQLFEENGNYYINNIDKDAYYDYTLQINSSAVTGISRSFLTEEFIRVSANGGFGVLGDRYIALQNGIIYFISRNLIIENKIDFLPAPAQSGNPYSSDFVTFYQSANRDRLFFVGSDKTKYCNTGCSTFFAGSIDLSGKIIFQQYDLGSPVIEHRSYFNEDGSAAHIVLLQTSGNTTDLILIQTDTEFRAFK